MLASFSEMPLPTVRQPDRRKKGKSLVTTPPVTEDLQTLKGQLNTLAHWMAEAVTYLEQARDHEEFDDSGEALNTLTECGKLLVEEVLYPGVNPSPARGPFFRKVYRWIHWKPCSYLPDANTTVMVSLDTDKHDEPVWLGYHDGLSWQSIEGGELEGVLGWADLPEEMQR